MAAKQTAAATLVQALKAAGVERLFTLSGNQILPIYDACLDFPLELVHVRHEAAAVHMADAWGRLTERPGVALVTAGPGHANALSALFVAAAAEAPLVLLSGHCSESDLGRGGFQEMAQAHLAAPLVKAAWTASNPERLARGIAYAMRVAMSGRPGPVHISLPHDVLMTPVDIDDEDLPRAADFLPQSFGLSDELAQQTLDALAAARRPLVLVGPALMRPSGRRATDRLAVVTGLPMIRMESPRGTNDPSLGAVAQVFPEADVVLLLGKKLDFSLGFGDPAALDSTCRLLQIDADPVVLEQTERLIADRSRLQLAAQADPIPAAVHLAKLAGEMKWSRSGWAGEVDAAVRFRPEEWKEIRSDEGARLHPVEVCRAVRPWLNDKPAVFVSDGGEFGQWAQACLAAEHRLINGPSGSIGSAIPFALAARLAFPDARVVATLGDGTFGFHAMEFDTAVRYRLPLVAVVGNDAAWNAEKQLQMRIYGPDRLIGCDLLPSRYDRVVEALGGHGENVERADALGPALQRAAGSALPACVNVATQPVAAPIVRRNG